MKNIFCPIGFGNCSSCNHWLGFECDYKENIKDEYKDHIEKEFPNYND